MPQVKIFSIIIPFKSWSRDLEECLEKIQKQTFSSYEVILLPDNKITLPEIYNELPVEIFPTGAVNPALKRDLGSEKATGQFLAFIDDDAYPQPDWLEVALNTLKNRDDIAAIGGPAITPKNDPFWARVFGAVFLSDFSGGFRERYVPSPPRRMIDDWPTVNLIVRKEVFNKVLVSVGRKPNTGLLNTEATDVKVNDSGFIQVDVYQRTSVKNIFAIGDIVGDPMLAHKATHEGKVAAEVASGHPAAFDVRAIPSVVYTDPEVAWAGLTEINAKENEIPYEKGEFPWSASGKALTMGINQGKTKILFDPETKQVLGMGIVGPSAGDMISEGVLAIEMGADADDLAMTILFGYIMPIGMADTRSK